MVTWESYDAVRAFERSRKRAFVRLAKASISRKRKGLRYSGILSGEEFMAALEDLELLDVEGCTSALPALPESLKASWIKEYNGYGHGEGFPLPFAARLEDGRLALEGGMPELMRLELLRAFGETHVAARMEAGRELSCDVIEYPERAGAARCPDRAAS